MSCKRWMAFLDPRFSLLELNSRGAGHQFQYLDVVTGWRGASPSGERARDAATQRSAQLLLDAFSLP